VTEFWAHLVILNVQAEEIDVVEVELFCGGVPSARLGVVR